MTEIEKAFEEAQKKWNEEASVGSNENYHARKERFFFFAGSEFGVAATKKIYNETFGKRLGVHGSL